MVLGGEDVAISRDDNLCQLWLVVCLKLVTTLPSLPFQRITSSSVRTLCKRKLLKKSIIEVVAQLRSFEDISELGSKRLLLVRLDRLWLLWLLSTLAITNLPAARCHHSNHLYLWPIFVTVLYLNLYLCFSECLPLLLNYRVSQKSDFYRIEHLQFGFPFCHKQIDIFGRFILRPSIPNAPKSCQWENMAPQHPF